jgi:tetratricopeptide (TPR) repeat protein
MTISVGTVRGALLLLLAAALAGCLPSGQSPLEEENEPHFLTGKSRASAMDYRGAVEAFERALEVNPHSASAHLELGWLYDQKESDPAAAIYHYGRYLRQRPDAPNAETVNTRILACKQELARTVSLGPVTQNLQREFEQLTEENKRLRDEVQKLQASQAPRLAAPTNPAAGPPPRRLETAPAARPQPESGAASPAPPANVPARAAGGAASGRTHTVKAGETPAAVARKYGVRVDALLAANPRLDPRRLRVGQVLTIPGS